MLTTHTPPPREAAPRRAQHEAATPVLDPTSWQKILQIVRTQHPSLNRSWFDQLTPRQLNNGVIQVNVATPAQLTFCQSQCQQPFTQAAQRSEEHTSELQSRLHLVCRLLLEKKNT